MEKASSLALLLSSFPPSGFLSASRFFSLSLALTELHSAQLPLYEAPLRRWKQNNSSGPELHNGSGPFFLLSHTFPRIVRWEKECGRERVRERERMEERGE